MGGKFVFIDYHGPHFAHPVKCVVNIAFDALKPFAKDRRFNGVACYGCWSKEFAWRKQTNFGVLQQKVLAEQRSWM